MKSALVSALLGSAFLLQSAVAHPGDTAEQKAAENAKRNEYFKTNPRSLGHCAEKLKARGNDAALQARRAAIVADLRKKRSISVGKIVKHSLVMTYSHRAQRSRISVFVTGRK